MRDCSTCTPELQKKRGCLEETDDESYWIRYHPSDEPIKRCPAALVTYVHRRAIQLTNCIEMGLPEPGGLLDQAAGFLQAAAVIQRLQEEERKRNANE